MRKFIHGTNHTQLPVSQTTHTVICMYPDASTSFHCRLGLVKGCIRVAECYCHPFVSNRANKLFDTIAFRRKGNLI